MVEQAGQEETINLTAVPPFPLSRTLLALRVRARVRFSFPFPFLAPATQATLESYRMECTHAWPRVLTVFRTRKFACNRE